MRDGRRASILPGKQAGRQTGWVARTWKSGGHPILCRGAVIRCPSGRSGLFELYVPLIIHLGCGALRQAHKDLIYSFAGNERTWRCWTGIRDCETCCQEIELMDGLQHHSTPTTTPFPSPALPPPRLDSTHLGLISLFMVTQWEWRCTSVSSAYLCCCFAFCCVMLQSISRRHQRGNIKTATVASALAERFLLLM